MRNETGAGVAAFHAANAHKAILYAGGTTGQVRMWEIDLSDQDPPTGVQPSPATNWASVQLKAGETVCNLLRQHLEARQCKHTHISQRFCARYFLHRFSRLY